MASHGDRIAAAKPLNELLAEDPPEYGEQGDDSELTFDAEEFMRGMQTANEVHEADPSIRMQAAAIAASSYGAAGCFDDDMLLRRSNSLLNFIMNGLL
jgi:hypothetical protein